MMTGIHIDMQHFPLPRMNTRPNASHLHRHCPASEETLGIAPRIRYAFPEHNGNNYHAKQQTLAHADP